MTLAWLLGNDVLTVTLQRNAGKTVVVSFSHWRANWFKDKRNIHYFAPENGFSARHFPVHFLSQWKRFLSKHCLANQGLGTQNKHVTESLGLLICIQLTSMNLTGHAVSLKKTSTWRTMPIKSRALVYLQMFTQAVRQSNKCNVKNLAVRHYIHGYSQMQCVTSWRKAS